MRKGDLRLCETLRRSRMGPSFAQFCRNSPSLSFPTYHFHSKSSPMLATEPLQSISRVHDLAQCRRTATACHDSCAPRPYPYEHQWNCGRTSSRTSRCYTVRTVLRVCPGSHHELSRYSVILAFGHFGRCAVEGKERVQCDCLYEEIEELTPARAALC